MNNNLTVNGQIIVNENLNIASQVLCPNLHANRSQICDNAGTCDLLYDSGYIPSDAAAFDITGISQDYDHLEGVLQLKSASNLNDYVQCCFNGDTSIPNYERAQLHYGDNTGQSVQDNPYLVTLNRLSDPANDYNCIPFKIPYYTSNANKKILFQAEQVQARNYARLTTTNWNNNAAITRLFFNMVLGSNVRAGSRLMLYGIKAK